VVVKVGVRELRENLASWLDRVQAGDEVIVTERGRPVALDARMDEYALARLLHDREPLGCRAVIVSLHVATGAAAGALAGSRRRAIALGLLLHALGDAMPHNEIASKRFEIRSGLALLALLALARGPLDPAVVGAAASSAPDVEHVLPLPKPGGRDLFPSHRIPGWHRSGGVPVWAQLVAAGVIVGLLIGPALTRKEPPCR